MFEKNIYSIISVSRKETQEFFFSIIFCWGLWGTANKIDIYQVKLNKVLRPAGVMLISTYPELFQLFLLESTCAWCP